MNTLTKTLLLSAAAALVYAPAFADDFGSSKLSGSSNATPSTPQSQPVANSSSTDENSREGTVAGAYNGTNDSRTNTGNSPSANSMEPASGVSTSSSARVSSSRDETTAGASVNAEVAGMSNDQIEDVQESLKDKGYSLTIDGVWGPETANALRSFQRANNLRVTGQPDSETLSELDVSANASGAGSRSSATSGY